MLKTKDKAYGNIMFWGAALALGGFIGAGALLVLGFLPFPQLIKTGAMGLAGVALLAFVAGLGWTISTWSHQIGDVLILTVLSAILAVCFGTAFPALPLGLLWKLRRQVRFSITCFISAASSGA